MVIIERLYEHIDSKDEPQVALGVDLGGRRIIKKKTSYSLDELAGPVLCEFTETSI